MTDAQQTDLDDFRAQTRSWLEANCPVSMRTRMLPGEEVNGGRKSRSCNPDAYRWLERMAERGWTVPTWPVEYGGAGLDKARFLLLAMDSPGVSVRPIVLINSHSPFCQTFFDNVRVPETDLVGGANDGWTVGKRLVQHERSGLTALASADSAGPLERIRPSLPLAELARRHAGPTGVDPGLRRDIVASEMHKRAFLLTQQRCVEESEAATPGPATSIFKYVEAEYVKQQLELQLRIRGTAGLGWAGETFGKEAQRMGRLWLESKAISIAGGSIEIQLNIIARRVLGLPD